ncbi:tol-pal system YbgF family protein [Aequorivita sp. CIP111184]|uniref:tetratricopeptide repeat protein n=1 Tax=Aequorivita sp. CIP111184 TaxID=2211356 RepID=UPI000DBBB603|nr:hypothetical protein [Aequorivita sp. CIP111184]SRX55409.1 hypothetical protein AEQU1_02431 [Aequorivita sp. CIP111184]
MNKEELIAQYFSGQISQESFLALKTLLEKDRAFKKDFYAQLEVQQIIAQEKNIPLKERLDQLDQKSAPKTKWYLYAAAATILIAIGSLFYNSQPDYQELYAKNFEAYPNVIAPIVRGNEAPNENKMSLAFRYYDNKGYAKAADIFKLLYNETDEDYAFFYYSVSLMGAGETTKAISTLEQHSWNEPQNYQTITHWYLGLGYLKLGNKEKAIFYLKKVAVSGKPLTKQAKEILRKLQ